MIRSFVSYLMSGFLLFSCGCSAQSDPAHVDRFTTQSGKTITFHAIKHGSIRITVDDQEIDVDPVADYAPKTDYGLLPKADIVLVTHEHPDHFDPTAIQALSKPTTRVVANARCAEMLGYGEAMRNGDTQRFDSLDVGISVVPAYNRTPERLQFHPKGRDNGYVLSIDGFRIYIAGDTEDIPEMARLHDIDVAFLPCNLPYTMTPEQVGRSARTFKPKVLFPYHYGVTKIEEVSRLLKNSGIDVRIRSYQ